MPVIKFVIGVFACFVTVLVFLTASAVEEERRNRCYHDYGNINCWDEELGHYESTLREWGVRIIEK